MKCSPVSVLWRLLYCLLLWFWSNVVESRMKQQKQDIPFLIPLPFFTFATYSSECMACRPCCNQKKKKNTSKFFCIFYLLLLSLFHSMLHRPRSAHIQGCYLRCIKITRQLLKPIRNCSERNSPFIHSSIRLSILK